MIQITTDELRNIKGQNGLAFMDCAMNPYELLVTLNQAFVHGGILLNESRLERVLTLQHDGKVDVIIPFDSANLEPTKLVMWQMLTFQDCHGVFLSDYICNTLDAVQEDVPTPEFGTMQM